MCPWRFIVPLIHRSPAELRDALEASQAEARAQLKAKEDAISSMVEEAAAAAANMDELRAEVASVRGLQEEVEELREMKADVERKEKQLASIIENQVSGPLSCYKAAARRCKYVLACFAQLHVCDFSAGRSKLNPVY